MVRTGIIIADEMTLIGDDAGGGVIFHLSALFQSGLQKTATQVIMMTSEKHPAPPETQGSGISNFPKSAQPVEMYYPLDIATKLVQKYYPGVDLLSYANTAINIDKICLLVDATKDDVEVITVDRHENSVLPVLTHAPDMFVLGIRESKSVELRGNDSQCDFTRGYTFSSGQPVETHPYDNAQPAELQYATNNWVWRIINKVSKQTHIVELARDCLFVLHLELAKQFPLIENESQPESTLLVETLKVEIPDLKEPVVALATHQVAGLPHEMQGDEPSVQAQPRSSESRENMGMFSYTNVGALMRSPMPRKPSAQVTDQDTENTGLNSPSTTKPAKSGVTSSLHETQENNALGTNTPSFEVTPFTESEIIELINSQRQSGLVYKLKKVAKIAKCTTKKILHFAGTGEITIITSVQSGFDLLAFDWLSGSTANQEVNPEIEKTFRPEMLVLDPQDCRQIARHGETDQCDFKNGYKFNGNGTAQIYPPNSFAPIFRKGGWVWRSFREEKPEKIKITRDRLFLLQAELTKLIKLIEAEDHSECQKPEDDAALNEEKQAEEPSANAEAIPPTTPSPAEKGEANSEAQSMPDKKIDDVPGKIEYGVDKSKPPGKMPNTTIGKLAILAAWEIECETLEIAEPPKVIERLQAWVTIKKYPALVESTPHGVKWETTTYKKKEFTLEACQKALGTWNMSRA